MSQQRRVLDWQLEAFSDIEGVAVSFVGGYMADLIEEQYPDIRFFFNPDWASTGPAKSLSLAALASGKETFICYSDVLFRPESVNRLRETQAEVVLAVDTLWERRYEGRSSGELQQAEKVRISHGRLCEIGKDIPIGQASAEFVGLLRLSAAAASHLRQIVKSGSVSEKAGLPTIIMELLKGGFTSEFVDIKGDWAELNAPQDLARFVLGTKAESLDRLQPMLRRGQINEQVSFTLEEWTHNQGTVIARIRHTFGSQDVIVRSSARSEDTWFESSAGAYTSLLNIAGDSPQQIENAVTAVFDSFGDPQPDDQVLVQAMLEDVRLSGVLMTRTPTMGAPYVVINFDSETGSTDSVTSGEGTELRTVFLHRDANLRRDLPLDLHHVPEAARELEELVGHDSLDIEYAVTQDGVPQILQVRPITVQHRE
ncbi:MAG: PEP/pyruvate-binding domain-containing protein, partial [Planctomycetaceae bacterium]